MKNYETTAIRNMKRIISEIKKKISFILRDYNVKKAAIFGSFARGDTKKNSDIDILVEFSKEKSLLDLVGLKLDLEDILKRKVDVVEYSTIHPLLKNRILKEQVSIL